MKLLKYAGVANKLKNDPIGLIIDTLIVIVVNLLIPIPLAGPLVAQFRGPVLGCLASLVILMLFMITVVGTIFISPLILSAGFLQSITSIFQENNLHIAPDTSFTSTSVPRQNPLGGQGMTYTTVTAYFLDPSYYIRFGKNHTGIDLVPNNEYYSNSKTYQDSHKVVAFATINGNVRHYVDSYGGETIEITNSDNSLKVLYVHFSTVLVESGYVSAGTPIGIMGETGFTTGEHVHYEVRTKDGNNWLAVNPLNYIQ